MCFECPILESSNTHTLSGVSCLECLPKEEFIETVGVSNLLDQSELEDQTQGFWEEF